MSDQFTGFWIPDDGEPMPPVSTGRTRQEAFDLAITRTLSMGITDGQIGAQAQDNISPDEFAKLTAILNAHFERSAQ